MLRHNLLAFITGLIMVVLLVGAAVNEGDGVADDTFVDCSSHCGDQHDGERIDLKLCVELCRLFEFPEPASMD